MQTSHYEALLTGQVWHYAAFRLQILINHIINDITVLTLLVGRQGGHPACENRVREKKDISNVQSC